MPFDGALAADATIFSTRRWKFRGRLSRRDTASPAVKSVIAPHRSQGLFDAVAVGEGVPFPLRVIVDLINEVDDEEVPVDGPLVDPEVFGKGSGRWVLLLRDDRIDLEKAEKFIRNAGALILFLWVSGIFRYQFMPLFFPCYLN